MPGRDPLPNWDQYATRWTVLHGGVDPRRARTSVGTWLRSGYVIAKFCARVRIKPATITLAGLLACLLIPLIGPARHRRHAARRRPGRRRGDR